jgi:hypothetical protein
MSYADALICLSSLSILCVRQNDSASNATGVNHLFVVTFHVLLVYAKKYYNACLINIVTTIDPADHVIDDTDNTEDDEIGDDDSLDVLA